MEFRILGSIEAVGDEGPLPLGAPKQLCWHFCC
jgi:hypothetical protein